MRSNQRNFVILLLLVAGLFFVYQTFMEDAGKNQEKSIDYTSFQKAIETNDIKEVVMRGDVIKGKRMDGSAFTTKIPEKTEVANILSKKGVKVEVTGRDDERSTLWSILISWFPTLLFIGVWVYFYRQMQGGGGGKAMGFGKSKAKLLVSKGSKVTFKDVAGITESKQEVEEIVEFLKDPQKFQRLGGKIPKGILLIGSPGNGKTLLARAIAGEANVPFFSISGSDFVEMFVGVGASRVRDMFEQAKKHAPCIVFIDEIDAVGRHRGAGVGGGNDEREQTLNQLLVEMDGFESNEGIILVAATNRPDVLDPALLRPGRFDRQVVVPAPDVNGREDILKVHLKKIQKGENIDPRIIARGTPGFSGADLANLVNEAALLAARKGRRSVSAEEMEEAKDKVMMGAERRSLAMSDTEKKLTAYHEAGHALVGFYLPDSDPIHKATIIPRGRALGMVMRLPEGDRLSMDIATLKADIAVAMGGRIAEEKIFGKDRVTTGASSDIKYATELARRMVTEWGLSEKMGPIAYGSQQQEIFLGHSSTQRVMSEKTSQNVDQEVHRIINEGYKTAQDLLTKHAKKLETLAQALIEFETLTGAEIKDLLGGKKIKPLAKKKPRKINKTSLPILESVKKDKVPKKTKAKKKAPTMTEKKKTSESPS
jgi:cell division protease FtsH